MSSRNAALLRFNIIYIINVDDIVPTACVHRYEF